MQKPLGGIRPDVPGHDGGGDQADDVDQYGDGSGRQKQDCLFRPGQVKQKGKGPAEGEHGYKGAQPGAGIHHLQCRFRQVEHVSLAQDGDADHADDLFGDTGCEHLHGKGHPVPYDGGDGDHEYQVDQGDTQLCGNASAPEEQGHPEKHHNHGGALQKILRSDFGHDQLAQAGDDDNQPPCCRFNDHLLELAAHGIDHEGSNKGNQVSVGIVVVLVPVGHHGLDEREVEGQKGDCQDGQLDVE